MAAGAVSPARILLLLLAVAAVAVPRHAGATEYTVGDSDGWTNGPSYLAWSQKYNLTAGDTLVFNYVRRQHDVLQVTQDAFRTCEPANRTVLRAWASGRDVVDLAAPGDYYFICNVSGHCLGGMKFAVTVGVPPPPPSAPPPPPAFTTEPPPPPPPSSTGASSQRPDAVQIWRLAVVVVGLWISLLLL